MKSGRKASARSSPAKGAEKWGDDVDDSARPPFFGLPFDGDVAVSSDDVKVDATPAFVFHCSKLTVDECLNKKLFAMPDTTKNKKMMTKIEKDTKIQLYNVSTKELHGVFRAVQRLDKPDKTAFGGKFNLQVVVEHVNPITVQKLDATVKMGPHKNLMGIEADDAVELLQLVPSQVASRAPIERAPIDLLQLPVSESSAPPSSFELHAFLVSAGVDEKYERIFINEEVDLPLLSRLSEQDLRTLGLTFGAARRITEAFAAAAAAPTYVSYSSASTESAISDISLEFLK